MAYAEGSVGRWEGREERADGMGGKGAGGVEGERWGRGKEVFSFAHVMLICCSRGNQKDQVSYRLDPKTTRTVTVKLIACYLFIFVSSPHNTRF